MAGNAEESKPKARNKPNSNQVEVTKSADTKRKSTRAVEKPAAKQRKVETNSPIPRPKGAPFADALSPDLLEFLYELKQDNNREFMRLHEKRWHAQRNEFIDFVKMVSEQLHEMDPTVMVEDPKQAIYRQHRDLRFTNDLRPYKTYVSASFSRGGKKSPFAGYYLAIAPEGESHAAAGIWLPEAPRLGRIREGIIENGDLLREALNLDAIEEIFGQKGISVLQSDDKLKVAPRNIPKDHPEIELLRYKSFVVSKSFSDEQVVAEGFLDRVLDVFEALVPFITVLNAWTG